MKFRATIKQNGKTATGFEVPENILTGLGTGKRPSVRVTINGTRTGPRWHRWAEDSCSGSAPRCGRATVSAGDIVDVAVELDTAPRDFEAALKREAAVRQFFGKLSYSNRRRFVDSIEDTKTLETRERRITKPVAAARGPNLLTARRHC